MLEVITMLHHLRKKFITLTILILIATLLGIYKEILILIIIGILYSPILLLGLFDMFQKKHTLLRNFPVLGHFRYILESIRPEIHQYFVETDRGGRPFSRDQRAIVYQRAKKQLDTRPFGTQINVYETGYEWVNHSITPLHLDNEEMRCLIGGPNCLKPYNASILNISAMSYGALSSNAIQALNKGAKKGNFAHNTGEGSISPHHLKNHGDLIWQIGTGYFGCRTEDGNFNPDLFKEKSLCEEVKMIEIKISQGAKPGHGGILPAIKNTKEIAAIRHVPQGTEVLSPGFHTTFSTPIELCLFIQKLRDLSGGKPIGIKLCIGKRREFLAICKAMVKTGIAPDYICVDGGEGGTGAAPLEFQNHIGCPLREALVFVHNALVGFALRKNTRLIVGGRIITGFDIISHISSGADMCYSARGMMMALGCIQALQCNSNICPTGVATHDKELVKGLVIGDKAERVHQFHKQTLFSVKEILGSMGIKHTNELRPWHLMRRIGPFEIKHYGELFEYLEEGALLQDSLPKNWARACKSAHAESFDNPHQPSFIK
jgi:glutamate synthase domain-containing protein 2